MGLLLSCLMFMLLKLLVETQQGQVAINVGYQLFIARIPSTVGSASCLPSFFSKLWAHSQYFCGLRQERA